MKRPLPSATFTRRRALQVGAAAALGAGLASVGVPSFAQGAGTRVRLGYIADFQGASLYAIASKQDLWKKYGLNPDIKGFTNGPIQIQAMGAGDLDFGYIGPGALWLPMSGKAKLISINVVGFSDRVIAQPGIKSVSDLRGKTVAVPEGTSGDMLLRLALQKAGLKMEDVKRVSMDPATIVTAFISGQVEAAGIWYPHVATIKTRLPNTNELFSNKDALPQNSFPSSFIMRSELDAPAHAATVDAMIRVLKEANDFRAKNLQESIDWTAAMIGAPRANLQTEASFAEYYRSADLVRLTQDGTVNRWLTGMNDMFKTFGRVPDLVDPKSYYLGERYIAAR